MDFIVNRPQFNVEKLSEQEGKAFQIEVKRNSVLEPSVFNVKHGILIDVKPFEIEFLQWANCEKIYSKFSIEEVEQCDIIITPLVPKQKEESK